MIGLFEENGPCHFVDNASEPTLNEHSWNNVANMLFIDQPVGVGFSYGNAALVNSTPTAAPYVWNLLQAFFTNFPEYESRDFGIFTESYGGKYAPEFSHYIQKQNALISAKEITGHEINLVALGINNGWFEEVIAEQVCQNTSFVHSTSMASYRTDKKPQRPTLTSHSTTNTASSSTAATQRS